MKNNTSYKNLFLMVFMCLMNLVYSQPPEPELGQRWVRNDQYSDEFNGTSLNANKWNNTFSGWQGRQPAYFNPNTVSVTGGNMVIRNNPGVPAGTQSGYTISGGAVQSKGESAYYGYYECNFKSSKINMSTTFWLSSSKRDELRTADNNDSYSQELDIAESIGGTSNFSSDFRKKMKFNTHYRLRKSGGSAEIFYSRGNNEVEIRDGDLQSGDASLRGGTEAGDAFHTYGCYWINAKEAAFYVDNNAIGVVKFRTDIVSDPFKDPMKINMVTETYDWARPLPTNAQLNDNNINASLYNWIRAYAKLPVDEVTNLDDENEAVFTQSVDFKSFIGTRNAANTYSFPVLYKSNADRTIRIVIKKSNGEVIKEQDYVALAGFGHKAFTVSLTSSLASGIYSVTVQLMNGTNVIASKIQNLTIQGGIIPNPTTQLIANGDYTIESTSSNQRLLSRAADNHNAVMHDPLTYNDQKWVFNHLGNNVYTIKNKGTNRFLEVPNAVCQNSTQVNTYSNATSTHQQWKVVQNGNGIYGLQPAHCLTQGLDRNNGTLNTNVHTYNYSESNGNQKWKIIAAATTSKVTTTNLSVDLNTMVYPNPISDNATVSGLKIGDNVTIYDFSGNKKLQFKAKSVNEIVNFSTLKEGTYFVSINGNKGIQVIKK
ncbi:hypothetical protein HNQ02_003129 [Flavobacterium sp. 7E]|uniref:RICIN domain-containing protein n=1 Tax=Flavobacterium sp. 7E TaxID=2735898 RepID=UPI00156F82F1|nr:RICIN domain-containing protein [Flavobacterium sp. 7E]NRS90192.1 hypothetical protein [Flavobacterium sp. 7E]